MPELPEVETTRRGIEPHLVGHRILDITVHDSRLRWPVPRDVLLLKGATVDAVRRRGKYLLIDIPAGTAIVHLGMSGSLRLSPQKESRRKHDHVELRLNNRMALRFHDPRRFGCWLWQARDADTHELLAKLGPEPLSDAFHAEYLFNATRKRSVAIKNLIMNSHIVVGVGNIYASESLYMAGVRPGKAAHRVSRKDCAQLCASIKSVLQKSIDMGGTTLRDFINSDGSPGYFKQSLYVYGREGMPCRQCSNPVRQRVIGQRSTFYCSTCQR